MSTSISIRFAAVSAVSSQASQPHTGVDHYSRILGQHKRQGRCSVAPGRDPRSLIHIPGVPEKVRGMGRILMDIDVVNGRHVIDKCMGDGVEPGEPLGVAVDAV